MIRPIRTASDAWIARHRATHARAPSFGTHRHPYLTGTIRELALELGAGEKPSLLDYGCGKGVFLEEMRRSGWFRFTRGYDLAVDAFRSRPAQLYDIVLCLDVLDQVEPEFAEPVIADVAQFARHAAVFDVITVQVPQLAHLNPRPAAEWEALIGQRMRVRAATVRPATADELAEGACPERTIIVAEPR